MHIKKIIIVSLVFILGCRDTTHPDSSVDVGQNLAAANEFIDAFYSFNPDQLNSVLKAATDTKASVLYYQGWAEGGNYEIMQRHPCEVRNDTLVVCPITVNDDLIGALEVDFHVTDTFHLTVADGRILSVTTSSNDPPLYYEAKEWVQQNRPELIEEACRGMWANGTTPGDCVRAMVQGFTEFVLKKNEE